MVTLPETRHLSDTWSATDFGTAELGDYARDLITVETRRGLIILSLLSLTIHIGVLLFSLGMGHNVPQKMTFLTTNGLLAALSIHIAISARYLTDIKILNLLGMALLVVTGAALMLLAHRVGNLNIALLAGFALLFMAMPIMPWGLKESATVTGLIYLLLTASSNSVAGRFEQSTLWTLQFLIVASAITALVLVVRNISIRKHDIRTRFKLDQARRDMERLSNIDPLTACWNRRFLNTHYQEIAQSCTRQGRPLELCLLDIDLFKRHNDTHGHHVGDRILSTLSRIMRENLPADAYVVRLGGDEFAVLFGGGGLAEMVGRCLEHLKTDPGLITALDGKSVSVSTGYAWSSEHQTMELQSLYQNADQNLYIAKRNSCVNGEDDSTKRPMSNESQ